ncbi:MAG: hypothetical protein WA173_20215, partial [Pseudomonas sp.]|uniref:hypothetical protein n=1 Tax=Pseudomonas sp. TaxID=306 RepID=UPI003BB7967B
RCYLKSAGVWLSKQALNLRRSAIFAPIQAIKPARKRFYTASAVSGHQQSRSNSYQSIPRPFLSTSLTALDVSSTIDVGKALESHWPQHFQPSAAIGERQLSTLCVITARMIIS